jgi:hypothetical protein
MKLSADQREALDIILSTGEFETLVEHIEFLIDQVLAAQDKEQQG